MSGYKYAILYHNFYEWEGIAEIRSRIAALSDRRVLLLCSLSENLAGSMPQQQEDEKFLITANVGKDIGAKLLLIQLLLTLYRDIPYAVLLHDKRSYQKHSGRWEKEGLFSIIEPERFRVISRSFEEDSGLGIACAKGYLKNESRRDGGYNTTNSWLLTRLSEKYQIIPRDFRFVAGTMFWIRTALLHEFFGERLALDVRATLERGNALDHERGTVTHSWERLLSWIALSANYKIKEF